MLESPTPATWRITLPHGETAVPVARAMVRTAMQDLQMTADRTTAELLTGELVSNALKHTSGTHPVELVVERTKQGCRVEVHDDDPMLIDDLLDGPAPPPGAPGEAGAAGAADGTGTSGAPGAALEGGGPESGDVGAAVPADGSGPVGAGAAVAADDSGPVRLVERGAAAGHQQADERVPAQRAGGAGAVDGDGSGDSAEVGNGNADSTEARNGAWEAAADEVGDGTGEGAETDDAEAGTDSLARVPRAPGTSFIDAAEAAEAAETAARDAQGHGDQVHSEQGRGLLLLRSLSSDAGCRPTACGKAVWFTLPDLPHRRRR
ncbi:ATP-binding protein [Streptomyces kronopolitis]|uniref:ATP-binding protein n=1 Tax=Streptomyces kronopolitis TaxID=1612435 RepID=UPI0036974C69